MVLLNKDISSCWNVNPKTFKIDDKDRGLEKSKSKSDFSINLNIDD